MSLGLGDLKKKRKTNANNIKAENREMNLEVPKPQVPWIRSRTSRPWTSSGLQRSVRNRPRLNQADAVVSTEWMHLYTEHIFNIDLPQASPLMKAHSKLAAFEERLQDSWCSTMKALQSFCFNR